MQTVCSSSNLSDLSYVLTSHLVRTNPDPPAIRESCPPRPNSSHYPGLDPSLDDYATWQPSSNLPLAFDDRLQKIDASWSITPCSHLLDHRQGHCSKSRLFSTLAVICGYPCASGSRIRHCRPSTSPDLQIQPDVKPSTVGPIRDDGAYRC